MTKQTIYQALCAKLGREPTLAEIKADVLRILRDAGFRDVARMSKRARAQGGAR